jgi:hypothetical protein
MKKIKKNQNSKKGFVLLMSLLISSIILAISGGIYLLAREELVLSGYGRESQKAFFASDSGAECAIYWDIKQNAFATSSTSSTIACENQNKTFDPSSGITTFTIDFANGACAVITVDKITYYPNTTVESKGRNTCVTTNPRRVERALRITY